MCEGQLFRGPEPGGSRLKGNCRVQKQGIYVHIPFCLAKCRYCNFNSFPSRQGVPDAYIDALLGDLENEARRWDAEKKGAFASIYFGGGTPSLLEVDQMATIITSLRNAYSMEADVEVTVECNPATVNLTKLAAYRDLGVTRLSIGVQSLCGDELESLGRIHKAADALEALEAAHEAGFANLSADVMLGIPGQGLASLAKTLDGIARYVTHVSVYMLTLEPGTPLHIMAARGAVELPDEETVTDLYEHARHILTQKGFSRYEISNYCLPGYECLHNDIYWQRGNYAGLGAGAHSHQDGWRYSKMRDAWAYMKIASRSGEVIDLSENLTADEMLLEDLMLGLRTARGVDLDYLASRYGMGSDRVPHLVEHLLKEGHLVKRGNYVALSPRGVLVHDAISQALASAVSAISS